MEHIGIPHTDISASRLAFGCMRLGGSWDATPYDKADVDLADRSIMCGVEAGFDFFDTADIYTRTKAESVFGEVLARHPGLRDKIAIQTKCGIFLKDDPEPGLPGRFDFSREHILAAARSSLKRLRCGRIDVLLLHRPDPLMEPEEVAEALAQLKKEGSVRYFGVSNFSGAQMSFLQDYLPEPFVANQLEMSLLHADFVETDISVNQRPSPVPQGMDDTVQYCRKNKVLLQAWSPLAQGRLSGRDIADQPPHVKACADLVARMAEERGVPPEAVVLAWLLRHPAGIQPVIGTIDEKRMRACVRAFEVRLDRVEWYSLLIAARGKPMP
jgi:predicted oxidoreductase